MPKETLLAHEWTGSTTSNITNLHRLDDLEVGYALELRVLGSVEILLGYHNTLLEEVLVDRHPVLLRYQHLWAFNQTKTWQDVFARLTKSVEEKDSACSVRSNMAATIFLQTIADLGS